MKVSFKENVRIKNYSPAVQTMLAALVASKASVTQLVVTSANDSSHGAKSKHYTDEALDVRSHNFPTKLSKLEFVREMREMLGNKFYVFLEDEGTPNEHFHMQVRIGEVFP